MLLNSEDYIYVMSLPGYAEKEIAVPDLTFEIRFATRGKDRIDIIVDPLCGFRLLHDEFMGKVVVDQRRDFAIYFGQPTVAKQAEVHGQLTRESPMDDNRR